MLTKEVKLNGLKYADELLNDSWFSFGAPPTTLLSENSRENTDIHVH